MTVFHQHEEIPTRQMPEFNRAFIISILANGFFVIFQVIFAILSNSTSLLADAIHNLGDVLSLVVAWLANSMLKKKPTERSTYGMKKTTILAAFANGGVLIFTCGIIAYEAIHKFFSPSEVQALSVMVVAGVGVIVNAATAALFLKGGSDLNIRGAFLHLIYDALISVGVVISAGLLYITGWLWLDPLVGLLISVVILKGTWSLFRDSFRLIIDGVPRGISISRVRQYLESLDGVESVHDLHVWAISTRENALSVHLWMPEASLSDSRRERLAKTLLHDFNIHHITIQVEQTQAHCEDACKLYL
ncbi:cation diffusion facilitator family transporter [Legionella impletisoli]|uniref:Cation efflux system protein n=1 Tax=Legionella impletisoli TaxID=343510 RepID=A0A917JXP1_9GAMM|nr:cation diffusion facilitator family transporter [Legionella impletisoli]GGI89228.1 cation efflux system protein [Legionella impletisoli]